MHVANDGVCLMYESNYKKLLTKCLKCRLVNDEIKEMKDGIIQARFKMYCLSGCETSFNLLQNYTVFQPRCYKHLTLKLFKNLHSDGR